MGKNRRIKWLGEGENKTMGGIVGREGVQKCRSVMGSVDKKVPEKGEIWGKICE